MAKNIDNGDATRCSCASCMTLIPRDRCVLPCYACEQYAIQSAVDAQAEIDARETMAGRDDADVIQDLVEDARPGAPETYGAPTKYEHGFSTAPATWHERADETVIGRTMREFDELIMRRAQDPQASADYERGFDDGIKAQVDASRGWCRTLDGESVSMADVIDRTRQDYKFDHTEELVSAARIADMEGFERGYASAVDDFRHGLWHDEAAPVWKRGFADGAQVAMAIIDGSAGPDESLDPDANYAADVYEREAARIMAIEDSLVKRGTIIGTVLP